MIGGFARLGKPFIDRGMRKGTPEEDHDNVVTVYGGTGPWKKAVGYKNADDAYLLLLDTEGKVRWMSSGLFEEERYTELAAEIRALLKQQE